MNNLLRSQYVLEDKDRGQTPEAGNITGENHLYVTGGTNLAVSGNLTVTPTVIGKYDFNQFSWEGGARFTYNEKMWIGAGYRNQEAITGMLGGFPLKENTLRLGYAFDLTNFGVEAKTRASHEIMLSYIFPRPANLIRPPIKTPRYNF
jgi:type IX secretion system PorP/SprF family membrane protein